MARPQERSDCSNGALEIKARLGSPPNAFRLGVDAGPPLEYF